MNEHQYLKISVIILFITILFGTLGYHFFEDMTIFESFYMTIITISTVGFSEIQPLSPNGRVITIIIIVLGISIAAYSIGTLLRLMIEGEIRETFWRNRLEKEISKLHGHYIICGYGRIGSLICEELDHHRIKFVVIERDHDKLEQMREKKYLYIDMDGTSDEALINAGIYKAKGIVPAVRSDSDNVFITLTARGLRPDIHIISRSSELSTEVKLKRAGATMVVSPYLIGGRRMAQLIIRPAVVNFIDIAMMDNKLGLVMEEANITKGSKLVGKSLKESNIRDEYGVIIVAIKRDSGDMMFNPQTHEKIAVNDTIIVLGKKDDLIRMNEVI